MKKQKQISVREMDRRFLQSGKIGKYLKATTKSRIVFALALLTLFVIPALSLFVIL